MRILPDGTVEIRNKQTGATKIVKPDELPSYGISYEKYGKELDAYNTSIKGESKGDKKVATDLRKEFRQETNDLQFKTIRDSWGRMKSAGDTGPGDLTLMYSLIKLYDPNSVVREGELALADKTKGVPQSVILTAERVARGKLLSPQQRKEFISEGANIYNNIAKKQKEISTFYSGLAEQGGVDPNDVVGAIGKVELEDISKFPSKKQEKQPMGFIERLTTPPLKGSQLRESAAMGTGPLGALLFGTERQKALAGPAALAGAIPAGGAGVGLARAGAGALASLLSGSTIASQRVAEATKVGKISTQKLREVGDYFVKNIDPTVKQEWTKIKSSIKPTTEANTLLERLTAWGTKARSPRTGDLKSNAVADFYDFLRSSGRKLVEAEAPKLAEQTEKLAFLKGIPRTAGKLTWLGAKAGIAGVGIKSLLGL